MMTCVIAGGFTQASFAQQAKSSNLTQFVNPRIGTGGHGHVFLGANVPFGYVQLGPTEPSRGWDWCSGYHHSDSVLIGFGHQHLSGTGIGDLGDVAFLPVADANQKEILFSHANENVCPGYYAVKLQQPNVWDRTHCYPACRIPALYLRCRCTAGTAGARPEAGHRMGCGKGLQRRQDYIYHYGRSSLLQGLGKRPEGILLR